MALERKREQRLAREIHGAVGRGQSSQFLDAND